MPTPTSLLHQALERQASLTPDAPALWWHGRAISYSRLQNNTRALALRLAAEGCEGDRIAVLSWNRPEFVELIYGVPAAGRILVPLNARLAPAELNDQLRTTGATMVFGERPLLDPLQRHADFPSTVRVVGLEDEFVSWRGEPGASALPELAPENTVWILFTSGSTGRPKGAMLSHRSFMAGLRSAALARPVHAGDRYYYPFPLFHVSAHNVLLQHLYGAAVVLESTFDAGATLAACRELHVTTLSLAPTMIQRLLEHPDFQPRDLASVRTIGYGASAMPEHLLHQLMEKTGVGLCQSYGMTELSGSVAFLTVEDHRRAASGRPELLQSVGRPLPTASLKLSDEQGRECPCGSAGEILVQAPQCMEGYWNDETATRAALAGGWLHTGDIGRFDEEGYLYIVDRKKDMIISGGENIASREIEEALLHHTAVKNCAVIGVPDAQWGERPCAVLEVCGEVSDEELSEHCRGLVAGFKVPSRWVRVEEIPLNASGKVDKPMLRRLYG
jgi:acyl-CoA synthetase (AMP-forming)/AMP-acid ligase II